MATHPRGNRSLDWIAASGVVCPVCRGRLSATEENGMRCGDCGRVYPVRDGLPVLIAGEATLP